LERQHMSEPITEAAAPRPSATQEKLFTPNFLLASLVTLASFSSFYFLLATLPVYIVQVGGSESEVGLIIGVFSAVAVVLRPFVGRAADDRGKRLFILAGTALLAICSGLYTLARTVPLLLSLRLIHAVGWASFGTSTNALIADLAPKSRRGAAMGYFGMFSNLAMAVGPAIGVIMMTSFSFPVLFAASAGVALLAVILALPIKEPVHEARLVATTGAGNGIIERTALFPSMVLTLTAVTYGSIVSFLPLYAAKHQVENPGFFFTVYAITLIVSRGFTGQLSDRYGRRAVIAPGLVLATAGLWLLSAATSVPALIVVAILYGLAFASIQPALMALVVDRAPASRRGAAMGTYSAAMDLGIGIGSIIWGFVAQVAGFEVMYVASGCFALLALAAFLAGTRHQPAGSARA